MKTRYSLQVPGYSRESPEILEVCSPYDDALVAEVELLDADGMKHAVRMAHEAFTRSPQGLPGYERAAILQRLAVLMEGRQEELSLLIAREGGKPLTDARIEAARAVNTVRVSAEEATRIHGEEIPMQGSPVAAGRLAMTIREPIGVVAAVSAFNHPLNLIAHQVAPAVAAGCPVLIKPSLDTAVSCMEFMEMLLEAGLPPELGMAVPARNEVSEILVTSDRIGFFSFVGSARVGWFLRSKLAPGVRATLEHGGAAPVILDESADLDRAIPGILKGGYYHAGQVCVSVQRVLAAKAIQEEVTQRLADGAAALTVGDPTLAETLVGPLIRPPEVDRVHEWVEEGVLAGAECRLGGEPLDNHCYAATVLVNAPSGSKVMQEEVFGPVVVVNEFATLEEAISMANDVRWSFQAGIFTRDIDRALTAARRIRGAAVIINDHSAFRVDWMPFAGHGPSGLGVGGVKYSVADLTKEKLIVINVDEAGGS